MGNQSDNWVEDIFWLIVKTSWLLIVVCASVFMFIYKAIARQQASQPATVTVGVPVKPKSAQHDLGKKYKKTWLALSITLGIAFPPLYMFVTHDPHYIVVLMVGIVALLIGGGLSLHLFQRTQAQLLAVANEVPSSTPPALIEPCTPLNSYTIRLPADIEWNREKALHFIEQITSTFPSVILRLLADHTMISWQLVDTSNLSPGMVEPILRASYPAAEINISQITSEHVNQPFFRLVCSFKQVNEFVAR